jgi:hypothetical protein
VFGTPGNRQVRIIPYICALFNIPAILFIILMFYFYLTNVSKCPPKFAIANGFAFGAAPECLEGLNAASLALVSRNRNTSHMFAFYAGQHQSIRGFHTMFKSNVEHTSETIRTMSDLGMPNSISCVLSGPFTNAQKRQVEAKMAIDRQRIIAAFQFLSVNNERYEDLKETPLGNEFPEPLIVDSSEEDEDGNDPQEHIFETTVFFPDGSEVTPASGGHVNAHTFTVEALKRNLQGSASSLLTSRPTREYANDIGKHFLVDSFPLQFPYGLGGPREKRVTKVEYHECLEYYLRVANSNFMRPDFILLIHSLWEKERAMKSANFRCRTKMNDESIASKIALISPEAIEEEAQRRLNGEHRRGFTQTPAKLFFDTLEIACKSMAHTNEAAKNARRKMFSMWYSICAPGIFFTISPCDETNFRLRLYIGRAEVSDIMQALQYKLFAVYFKLLTYNVTFYFSTFFQVQTSQKKTVLVISKCVVNKEHVTLEQVLSISLLFSILLYQIY